MSSSKPDCFLEYYVDSGYGKQHYATVDTPSLDEQADITPIQRRFFMYCTKHHEPDPDEVGGAGTPRTPTP